ncbi:MAG: hypothetical protein RBR01_09835, partial [Desulfobacterales bacterium]|nr:hypothetical protein [Desulfobacterales bacterium]
MDAVVDVSEIRIQKIEGLIEQGVVIQGEYGNVPVGLPDGFPELVINACISSGFVTDGVMNELDQGLFNFLNPGGAVNAAEAFLMLDKIIQIAEYRLD